MTKSIGWQLPREQLGEPSKRCLECGVAEKLFVTTHPKRLSGWAGTVFPAFAGRAHFEERDQLHTFEESAFARFALADIGRVEETQDGEHAMLLLAIDEKQEKQIAAFIDPAEMDSQFARLSAAELDTCHRVGAYVGDWNDRQFEKTFGKPYAEPAEPRTPFFLRLPSEQAPEIDGNGKVVGPLPF